jgi:AmmeMemoRadiSam system protein A
MRELLKLARESIELFYEDKEPKVSEETKKKHSKIQGCFVTLTEHGQLRGCIGCINAHQELYLDVVENAINAAFNDPRFSPVLKKELKNIRIEVSVLSAPRKLEYKDERDLLEKIDKKMGIILQKGPYRATYLPQVWKMVSDKKQFLEELSQKAGMDRNAWKNAEVYYYRVEKAEE